MSVSAVRQDSIDHPRGEPRVKLFRLARLRHGDALLRAHLLDISPSGARMHCAADLKPGQLVALMVDDRPIPAVVLRASGGRIGLRFGVRLDEDRLRRIAAEIGSA